MTQKNSASQIFSSLDNISQFAVDLQDSLKRREITVVHDDISITILGNQDIKAVLVDGVPNENLRRAIEEAIHKSQKLAAETMSEIPQQMSSKS